MGAKNRVRIALSYRPPHFIGWRNQLLKIDSGLLKILKISFLDTEQIKDSEPEVMYVGHLVPDVRTEGGVLLLGYLTGEAAEDILQLRVKNLKILKFVSIGIFI
jgi:hypothetical protein